jgi:iron complex transport system ATP-binding protein
VNSLLEVNNVSGGYRNKKTVNNISFSVKKGEFIGLIGPNGSGKTTLLKILTNLLPKQTGQISVCSQQVETYSAKQLAQKIAVLPQNNELGFSYSVKQVVALGRTPYQNSFFNNCSQDDEGIVLEAMKQTEISSFATKDYQELSGGEKQRVLLARAFAQQPELLLLDEPANHLDIKHQIHLFSTIKKFIEDNNSVLAVFHDINMASLYCDRILVLHEGRIVKEMNAKDGLDVKCLSHVFETPFTSNKHPLVDKEILSFDPLNKR